MKTFKFFILFLILNFGALFLGSWLMNNGPTSEWYLALNKASWTPPGWVFGMAWFTIMFCFSIYLASLFKDKTSIFLTALYVFQLFLNVIWNYVFFNRHLIGLGLLVIVLLTLLVFFFFFTFKTTLSKTKYLLLPYMIWLCLATSLNTYIYLYN